jgi:formate-dependent nitrite reductase membrane component NrfD
MEQLRSPYGRRAEARADLVPLRGGNGALTPYEGQTYYDLPALNASHYGWPIASYFWIGGIAGSSQVLATIADLAGRGRHRSLVRAGRYLALAGAAASPIFLIADLHTPQRWYNMLRIFRSTSAMSIGSWTLAAFGTFSGLAALGQLWEDLTGSRRGRRLARLLGIPAGLAGAMMSVYTGTLLASTSTPLWASTPRLLPALFGTSAASTAAAALTLVQEAGAEPAEERSALGAFSLVTGAAELALAAATRQSWQEQELDEPLREEPLASTFRLGAIGLGVVVPLVIHGIEAVTGRPSRVGSTVAAVSTLVGGFLLRASVLFAGNESGRRAKDYFRAAQQPSLPDASGKALGRQPAATSEKVLV